MMATIGLAIITSLKITRLMIPVDATRDELQFGLVINTVIPCFLSSFCFYM